MTKPLAHVEQVQKEIEQVAQAVPLQIQTKEDFEKGAAMVVDITKELKARKAWFAEFLAPAKKSKEEAAKALKEQEALRDKVLQPLVQADATLRAALAKFRSEEAKKKQREQEHQNKLYEQRLSNAEAKGKPLEAVKPALVVPPAPKTTFTNTGGFTVKERKKLVVLDESKIPDQYFTKVLNTKLVETTLRAGIEVPGTILETVHETAVRV